MVAPVTAWGIASDIRASYRMDQRTATRMGPEENHADTSLTDRVVEVVPERDTYVLVISDRVAADRALVFRLWTISALLPRVAVQDALSADWVVTWGIAPTRLGVPVTDVQFFRSRDDPGHPVFVAKVVR